MRARSRLSLATSFAVDCMDLFSSARPGLSSRPSVRPSVRPGDRDGFFLRSISIFQRAAEGVGTPSVDEALMLNLWKLLVLATALPVWPPLLSTAK
jgi:hypothetical protein